MDSLDKLDEQEDVDQHCEAFEQAWRGASPLSIAELVDQASSTIKPKLFQELLGLEFELTALDGRLVDPSQYMTQYPEFAPIIRAEYQQLVEWIQTSKRVSTEVKQLLHSPETLANSLDSETIKENSAAQDETGALASSLAQLRLSDRYQVVRELGRGGMGIVLLAHDRVLNRKVAVKIPSLLAAARPKALDRFRREARAMAQVQHPNLCQIHDFGEVDGRPYLSMAWIEGQTLSELLTEKRVIQPKRAVELVRKLALAVKALHDAGVLHRDLKPSNVIVDAEGEPHLTDFGLALFDAQDSEASHASAELTASGEILGSPAYMAPEQVNGRRQDIGPATDVYALGVTLYELLSGRRPLLGNPLEVLAQLTSGQAPKPLRKVVGVDKRLEAICQTAMASRASKRFASAQELAGALSDWQSGRHPHFGSTFGRVGKASGGALLLLATVLGIHQWLAPATAPNHNGSSTAGPIQIQNAIELWRSPQQKIALQSDGSELLLQSEQHFGNTAAGCAASGDFDGDGHLDLAIANYSGQNEIWLNDGAGSFRQTGTIPSLGSFHVAAGDLDQDGDLDLMFANRRGPSTVWANDGDAGFSELFQTPAMRTRWCEMIDIEGDGDLDLVFAAEDESHRIWRNQGSGEFVEDEQQFGDVETMAYGVADFNGDGFPDLFEVNWGSHDVVRLNDGHGNFMKRQQELDIAGSLHALPADFEADGDIDLLVVCVDRPWRLLQNDGTGRFIDATPEDSFCYGWNAAICELNGNEYLDVVFAQSNYGGDDAVHATNGVRVCFDLLFAPFSAQALPDTDIGGSIAPADYDGDGDTDIFVASPRKQRDRLWINQTQSESL